MTKQERLKIYKQMLRDYRWALFWQIITLGMGSFLLAECQGFCRYIEYKWLDGNNLFNEPKISKYIELYSLKPLKPHNVYWFHPYKLLPRIKLIKQSIKLCENGEK